MVSLLVLTGTMIQGCSAKNDQELSQTKNIFGNDDRWVASSNISSVSYPYSTIGKLYLNGPGSCTATLVGPKLIVTAAHCVRSSTGGLIPNIYFYLGFHQGSYPAAAIVVDGKMGNYSSSDAAKAKNDWAVLLLDRDLGSTYGYMNLTAWATDDIPDFHPVQLAGYSVDGGTGQGGQVLTVDSGCQTRGTEEFSRIAHDCDIFGGASGGPMFEMKGSTAWISGIQSTEYNSVTAVEYTYSQRNTAVDTTEAYAALLTLWNR